MKNFLVKKSYFILKHTGMKIQTSAYFTYLTFLNPNPYQLTWYTFTKGDKTGKQLVSTSSFCHSSFSFVWSEVEGIISSDQSCVWLSALRPQCTCLKRSFSLNCAPLCFRNKAGILLWDQDPQFWSDHGHGACWRPLLQTHGKWNPGA